MSQPLAIHREANLARTGTFTLFADRLEVTLRPRLRPSRSFTLPLSDLSFTIVQYQEHIRLLSTGQASACALLFAILMVSRWYAQRPVMSGILVAATLLCLIFLVVSWRASDLLFLSVVGRDGTSKVLLGEGPSGAPELQGFGEQLSGAIRAHAGTA